MALRALVTGAGGFAGRRLCPHLEARGWDLCRTDIFPASEAGYRPCDMADKNQVYAMVQWAAPFSHVFHLAAVTFLPEAKANPERTRNINVGGGAHLAEAMIRHMPEARLIAVTSREVYGNPESVPITEDHPFNPGNPYAATKAEFDSYCARLSEEKQLDVVRVRPFNHSGPGQNESFALSGFARQIADIELGEAEPVLRVGNLKPQRDFSHVDDVVRAYELLARLGAAGEAYNVCSGVSRPVEDSLKILLSLSDAKISVEIDPKKVREEFEGPCYGSHERLTQATGWTPKKTLEEILQELLDYWRDELGSENAD